MNTYKRLIALTQWLLLLPAGLFMAALVVRILGPLQSEPARTAQQMVRWYAGRQWTLWVLLLALPLTALVLGGAARLLNWNGQAEQHLARRHSWSSLRTQKTMLVIAAATLTAGVILAIVVLHMLAN